MDARYKIAEAMMRGVGQPMAAFPDQRQDDDMALRGMASDLYQADQRRAQDYRAGIKEAILQSWPAELAKSAYGAVTLPGDVYAGRINPMSDEAVGRAAEFAGLLTLGAGASSAPRGSVRSGLARNSADDDVVKLYHGTTENGFSGINKEGKIYGPAFLTPRKSVAEEFSLYNSPDPYVIPVNVPKGKLLIDLDLPGARLVDVETANGISSRQGWSIDDWLQSGASVGTKDALPIR